jgi:dUTP pyrophosphatase
MKFVNRSEVSQLTKVHSSDAGLDIASNENIVIPAHGSAKVSTQLFLEIDPGYVGIVKSRSGLSFKSQIEVGAGVIDATYRGEVKVHLHNLGDRDVPINRGDRIAQLLTLPIFDKTYQEVKELSDTLRADSGFGSTGK